MNARFDPKVLRSMLALDPHALTLAKEPAGEAAVDPAALALAIGEADPPAGGADLVRRVAARFEALRGQLDQTRRRLEAMTTERDRWADAFRRVEAGEPAAAVAMARYVTAGGVKVLPDPRHQPPDFDPAVLQSMLELDPYRRTAGK